MSYEILEHTADEKFRATGKDLDEAFSEAVNAFSEIVGGGGGEYHHKVEIESENLEALLFDFMDELIFLQDSEGVLVSHSKDLTVEETEDGHRLTATILVDPITSDTRGLDIKGPTYSEMKVDYEKGEGWVIETVLDV